jgi:ankyrin repeat protein
VGNDGFTAIDADHTFNLFSSVYFSNRISEISIADCSNALWLRRVPGNSQGSRLAAKLDFKSTIIKMSLLRLPPEILYMISRYLEYETELYSLVKACPSLRPLFKRALPRTRTTPAQPIKIVQQLNRILGSGNKEQLRRYLLGAVSLSDRDFARKVCAEAVIRGQLKVVKLLVDRCPFLLTQQSTEGSPSLLDLAISRDQKRVRDFLAQYRSFVVSPGVGLERLGARVVVQSSAGQPPAVSAVEQKSLEGVKFAIEQQKCDIHSPSPVTRQLHVAHFAMLFCPMETCTPFWIAAANGSVDIVEYLLSRGANPNSEPYPAIFVAAHQNHAGVVSFLLDVKEYLRLETIYPVLWLSLLSIKNDATVLLSERLDLSEMCTHFCNTISPRRRCPDIIQLLALLVLAMNTSNREVIQQLMESQHAKNICQNLILRDGSSNASSNTFHSFDMSVRDNPEELLFLIDCIAQKYASLLVQVCKETMNRHCFLFEIFYQRYPQISSQLFPALEKVIINAQNGQDIPILTTLLRKYTKHITTPTWQKLLASRLIDKQSLGVILELGALEHINAEHVKSFFLYSCTASGTSISTTWLSLLERFNLDLNSRSTEQAPNHPGSPETLFERAIGTCDYEMTQLLLARPEINFTPTDATCKKAFRYIIEEKWINTDSKPDKIRLFLEKGFDPMQPCSVNALINKQSQSQSHKTGITAFHSAVINTNADIVKLFLDHGADPLQGLFPSRKCKFTTGIGIAVRYNRYGVIKLLLQTLDERGIRIDWLLSLLPLTNEDVDELCGPEHRKHRLHMRPNRNHLHVKVLRQHHWRFMYPVPRDDDDDDDDDDDGIGGSEVVVTDGAC